MDFCYYTNSCCKKLMSKFLIITSAATIHCCNIMYFVVSKFEEQYSDDEETVDVHSLPLKPPQPFVPPEKAVRRSWHPVMWDDHKDTPVNDSEKEKEQLLSSHEYPHTQRIRNLRRLIAEGKVKPESETLIFFLCNKFAVSDDRRKQFE